MDSYLVACPGCAHAFDMNFRGQGTAHARCPGCGKRIAVDNPAVTGVFQSQKRPALPKAQTAAKRPARKAYKAKRK